MTFQTKARPLLDRTSSPSDALPVTANAAAVAPISRFIVLWNRPGFGMAFEGDFHAASPREARAAFRALFPLDTVKAVKRPRGNGRFV